MGKSKLRDLWIQCGTCSRANPLGINSQSRKVRFLRRYQCSEKVRVIISTWFSLPFNTLKLLSRQMAAQIKKDHLVLLVPQFSAFGMNCILFQKATKTRSVTAEY
mmetsp:Transcript_42047/g.48391  ORF Transcript_42047/g.48391 Transcript_42047/m.48391 type:complete len:105 (-) Transcript_42047:118-432(-)